MKDNRQLTLWRIRVISITVPVAELTLTIVDKHFRLLVYRNLPCASYCFSLSIESLSNTNVTSAYNTPPSVIRNHVLIFSHTLTFMNWGAAVCATVCVRIVTFRFLKSFLIRGAIAQINLIWEGRSMRTPWFVNFMVVSITHLLIPIKTIFVHFFVEFNC